MNAEEKINIDQTARKLGYDSNKDVRFQYIESLYIHKFRSLSDRLIPLGKNITLITGKNGTLKSCILGLIAHPFTSPNDAKDLHGKELKTPHSEVFRLSLEKDIEDYLYYLNALTTTNKKISDPIRIYLRSGEKRHRLTVSGNTQGLGNFSLNTTYMNLKRLFPIIDTTASTTEISNELSQKDKLWISQAYSKIIGKETFQTFEHISDHKTKFTLGPVNSYYDFNSISSGEDNLGSILKKMIAFMNNIPTDSEENQLNGILCIDEIDASLHPVALTRLFDFLYQWSQQYHVQVIATTHSLYLIDYCLRKQAEHEICKEKININILSTRGVGAGDNFKVISNPTYKDAYKELTFNNPDENPIYKINILCEDKIASDFIKKIIKSKIILGSIHFITEVGWSEKGTPWQTLIALGKNGKQLLDDSIIVLDADVPVDKDIVKIRQNNVAILKLPDESNWAIEKRIVKYIINLDGSHSFFENNEKLAYKDQLNNIYNIPVQNIDNHNDIKRYKNWQEKNKRDFTKALSLYCKENEKNFRAFKDELLKLINEKRLAHGLPIIE